MTWLIGLASCHPIGWDWLTQTHLWTTPSFLPSPPRETLKNSFSLLSRSRPCPEISPTRSLLWTLTLCGPSFSYLYTKPSAPSTSSSFPRTHTNIQKIIIFGTNYLFLVVPGRILRKMMTAMVSRQGRQFQRYNNSGRRRVVGLVPRMPLYYSFNIIQSWFVVVFLFFWY